MRDMVGQPADESNRKAMNSPQRHKEHKEDTEYLCLLCALCVFVVNLGIDSGAQRLQELRQPLRMRRPRWSSDKVAIHMCLIQWRIDPFAAGAANFRTNRWIGRTALASQDTRRRQQLHSMADGG